MAFDFSKFKNVTPIPKDAIIPGLLGTNDSGTGVEGTSNSGTGVDGTSQSGRGVAGFSSTWQGVYSFSDSQAGVVGESNSFDGVFGISHSNQHAAVSGHNTAGGWAGFFEGNAIVTGTLTANIVVSHIKFHLSQE